MGHLRIRVPAGFESFSSDLLSASYRRYRLTGGRGVGAPATQALIGAGFHKLEDLIGVKRRELEYLHGVGPMALRILDQALEEHGHELT